MNSHWLDFTLCLTVYSGVLFYFIEKSGNDDMSMGEAIWWGVRCFSKKHSFTSLRTSRNPEQNTGTVLFMPQFYHDDGQDSLGSSSLIDLIAFAIPAGIISSRFAIIAKRA